MGLTFASTVTSPRLRLAAAASPRFRMGTSGERVNRAAAFAGVAPGAGAHAVIGPAVGIDECNLPGLHSTLAHPTSWA